jgi:hypothetical protein
LDYGRYSLYRHKVCALAKNHSCLYIEGEKYNVTEKRVWKEGSGKKLAIFLFWKLDQG